jgi:hypothetical protein
MVDSEVKSSKDNNQFCRLVACFSGLYGANLYPTAILSYPMETKNLTVPRISDFGCSPAGSKRSFWSVASDTATVSAIRLLRPALSHNWPNRYMNRPPRVAFEGTHPLFKWSSSRTQSATLQGLSGQNEFNMIASSVIDRTSPVSSTK